MSTPTITNGNYKLTSVTQVVNYKSSGNLYGNYSIQVNHDSSVTPGYLGYGMSWQGSGVYRVTVFGKTTFSATGLSDSTLDCSTNSIWDVTLDTNGNRISSNSIQTGCGGSSLEYTLISESYSSISNGMTRYLILEDSSYQYQITYTFLKQSSSSKENSIKQSDKIVNFDNNIESINELDILRIIDNFHRI